MIHPLPRELLAIRLTSLLTTGCLLLASASLLAFHEKESVAEEFKFKLPGSEKPVYQPPSGVPATRAQEQPVQLADPPEFGSPSLKEFPSALLHGFAGLIDSDNVTGPAVIGAWAAGAALLVDDRVKDYFEAPRRAKAIGQTGDRLGNGVVLAGITGALLVASYTGKNQKFRAMSFSLAQGFVISEIIVHSIKAATNRDRPSGENQQSFPSGHTSSTFTYATVISHYYGAKAGIPAYAVASLIGFSRMEKNKHHLSDVIAGATLGYLIGRTVVKVTDRRARRNTKTMTVAPVIGQETKGVSVRWTW
jgi:membrane-associated phospholipid phosphatase